MTSFCCYDNPIVNETLSSQIFILIYYSSGGIFLQVFVNGNVVNAQTWKVVPIKYPVKPSSITLTFNCQSYLFICCMAYRFYFFHEFFYLLFIIIIIIICYFEVAQGTHL